MKQLKEYWLGLSWIAKFSWIISIHFFINIISGIIFFLDDFSQAHQLVHSVIHLSFFALLIKLIYLPQEENRLKKRNEKLCLLVFIVLNLVPFSQGFEFADNGFVPRWAMTPQINFGLPFTYLHWFTTDFQNNQGDINNPLIHINMFTLNLYCWGIFIIVGWAIKKKVIGNRKRTD